MSGAADQQKDWLLIVSCGSMARLLSALGHTCCPHSGTLAVRTRECTCMLLTASCKSTLRLPCPMPLAAWTTEARRPPQTRRVYINATATVKQQSVCMAGLCSVHAALFQQADG